MADEIESIEQEVDLTVLANTEDETSQEEQQEESKKKASSLILSKSSTMKDGDRLMTLTEQRKTGKRRKNSLTMVNG